MQTRMEYEQREAAARQLQQERDAALQQEQQMRSAAAQQEEQERNAQALHLQQQAAEASRLQYTEWMNKAMADQKQQYEARFKDLTTSSTANLQLVQNLCKEQAEEIKRLQEEVRQLNVKLVEAGHQTVQGIQDSEAKATIRIDNLRADHVRELDRY